MSSSRVIRGTRAKIFLYVCAVLFVTGLIACYNSTLTQLDDVKRSNEVCHQQQDNLSTQLQVISDYKLKLEKSLQNEKAEHEQSKSNFENRIKDEKSKSQKVADDVLLKYNSLQQHQQLLQTKFDDYKEETSKNQKKQLEQINSLQSNLKELEEELKKVKASKESVKTQLTEVQSENFQLKKSLKDIGKDDLQKRIAELEVKYEALKKKCGESPDDSINKPSPRSNLLLPSFKLAEKPSSSTKTVLKILPSQGAMNGARPLNSPNVTPDSVNKPNLKPPQGVVLAPQYTENQNEHPEIILDHQKFNGVVDQEKDNAANEVLDPPDHLGGLDFADDKLNFDQKQDQAPDGKKHEDNADDFREEEDDDLDADYGHAHGDGAAVRN